MSPSLLTRRLKELEEAGIVERRQGEGRVREYQLTRAGEDLRPVVMALGDWGMQWTDSRLRLADYDPSVLMWDMRRRVRHGELPKPRTVIHFSFPDGPRGKCDYWLVLEEGEADLCLTDPGFEPDIHATGSVKAFADVWLGRKPFQDAIRASQIQLEGPSRMVRSFDHWFELSVFASARSA